MTTHDETGQVIHAVRYDESVEKVLEELNGAAAREAYGGAADTPPQPEPDQ